MQCDGNIQASRNSVRRSAASPGGSTKPKEELKRTRKGSTTLSLIQGRRTRPARRSWAHPRHPLNEQRSIRIQTHMLMCAEISSLFTRPVPKVKHVNMHLETISEDDDLLSCYGKQIWRRCLRSNEDCVFFAGPCTGGSPWNREMRCIVRRQLINSG